MSRAPSWTDEEVRIASMMHRAGRSPADIAAELGRSTGAVKHYISRQREINPHMWRVVNRSKRSEQPCWTCYYGGGRIDPVTHFKCPWADKDLQKPVEGWTATQVPYRIHIANRPPRIETTFDISDCPHYKEE